MHFRHAFALTAAAAAFAPVAQASDQVFTHTYLSELNPVGSLEVEQQTTYRTRKSQGVYDLVQSRTELEYGITSRWQASLYLNAYSVTARDNNSTASRNNFTVGPGDGDEVTGGGPATIGSDVPASSTFPIPAARYHQAGFESISVENIVQFASPYKDGYGLAGYVELTGGARTREVEFKLLGQKNLLEDDLILAANLAVEFERENWTRLGFEREAEVTLSGGASYRVANGWRLGLEMRNERAWEGSYSLSGSHRDYSAWFAGPTVQYAGSAGGHGLFLTGGWSQQLPWAEAWSAASRVELVGGRVYKESERNVFKLIAGVSF